MDRLALKEKIDEYVENSKDELIKISETIHENPELAFEEYKSAALLTSFLEKEGFDVTRKVADMETSFVASYTNGSYNPTIAIIAEYDALPNLGHACGHNIICTSAIGAGAALKNTIKTNNIEGRLLVIGSPAEEKGGGKIKLIEAGIFKDVDAAIMIHPTSATTRIGGRCLSSRYLEINYKGKSAHAGSHPENGINALDAANIYLHAVSCLRQQLPKDVRMGGIITKGGEIENMIPDYTSLKYQVRAFSENTLNDTCKRLMNCAKAGALATGCEVEISQKVGYKGRVPSKILGDVCKENFKRLGEPLMEGMPEDYGGTDFGDVSRIIPTCNPYVTIYPQQKITNHSKQFCELAISQKARDAVILSSKVMANTALDLFLDVSIIENAKEELINLLSKE